MIGGTDDRVEVRYGHHNSDALSHLLRLARCQNIAPVNGRPTPSEVRGRLGRNL